MTAEKIALFFDGTGNGPNDKNPSNVFKLYKAFLSQKEQLISSFYFPGPGASEYDVFTGQLVGSGIVENIKEAYRTLSAKEANIYSISLFGFSRGAYTVHMFAWLLQQCGIPVDLMDCDQIVDNFVENPQAPEINDFAVNKSVEIEFIGVWDIVKSIKPDKDFFDGTLPNNAKKAMHAMALDELRKHFPVMKWQNNESTELSQFWFAGVHSDIGGGYETHGLSDIAYKWIHDAVISSGLSQDLQLPNNFMEAPEQTLNDPFSDEPAWEVLGKKERRFEGEDVHSSVFERHKLLSDYTPKVSDWNWDKFC